MVHFMTDIYLVCVWVRMKNKNHFTIQLIFTTIYGSHYTFWHPTVLFQQFLLLSTLVIIFQFQQNKQYLNTPLKYINGLSSHLIY